MAANGGGENCLPRRPSYEADAAPKSEQLLIRPAAAPILVAKAPDISRTYEMVRRCAVPNYRGARVPLKSNLNIQAWRDSAHIHGDHQLPDLLEFGFPAGHVSLNQPVVGLTNHASALRNPGHVAAYLQKEKRLGAMSGPYTAEPFTEWFRNNPILTRPKRASTDLRVILDLSFPKGDSVNSGIPRGSLDGSSFKLRLPSPLDLASLILKKGPGCKLYKIDLSRAYRQLRGDPLDWPLMGVTWEGEHFVDLAVPFGLRHGASACQRVSEAAAAVAAEECGAETEAYVDDTAGAALADEAQGHYEGLLATCDRMGLEVGLAKCQPPCYTMLWIGVWYDAIRLIMAIDQDRIDEAVELCRAFLDRDRTTLHQLQKLLGKLFHASKCTSGARAFLARMLDLLRAANTTQVIAITQEARDDARWFVAYLDRFNGVTSMKPEEPRFTAEVDSCMVGGGGICRGIGFYAIEYPHSIVGGSLSISSLECLNLLFTVRLWADTWSGSHVVIFCDNMATVCAANSARAEDPLIRGALRELWWLAATKDVHIAVKHRPGVDMEVPDTLSRAYLNSEGAQKFRKFLEVTDEPRIFVKSNILIPPLCL